MLLDIILYCIIAGLILFLGLLGGGIWIKHSDVLKNDRYFIFFYHGLPRRVEKPDFKKSKYYDRFPKKTGDFWNYAPAIDDPWTKELAYKVMEKVNGKSDRYKAGYILKLVQYGYRYQKDIDTYGEMERWAFPVCLSYLCKGDCEDGALLGCALSKLCGLESVMVSMEGHALYGVNVKGFGMRRELDGKRYLLCETTGILPMGITLTEGKFKKCYLPFTPLETYLERGTYHDEFDQYKR